MRIGTRIPSVHSPHGVAQRWHQCEIFTKFSIPCLNLIIELKVFYFSNALAYVKMGKMCWTISGSVGDRGREEESVSLGLHIDQPIRTDVDKLMCRMTATVIQFNKRTNNLCSCVFVTPSNACGAAISECHELPQLKRNVTHSHRHHHMLQCCIHLTLLIDTWINYTQCDDSASRRANGTSNGLKKKYIYCVIPIQPADMNCLIDKWNSNTEMRKIPATDSSRVLTVCGV